MMRSRIVPKIKSAHIGYRDQAFKINDTPPNEETNDINVEEYFRMNFLSVHS